MSDRSQKERLVLRLKPSPMPSSKSDSAMVSINGSARSSPSRETGKRSNPSDNPNHVHSKKLRGKCGLELPLNHLFTKSFGQIGCDSFVSRVLFEIEGFSKLTSMPIGLSETIVHDYPYDLTWSFSTQVKKINQIETLSLTAKCEPPLELRNSTWYNIIFASVRIPLTQSSSQGSSERSKDLIRTVDEVISNENPVLEFANIEGIKILKDASRGYITAEDSLTIEVIFEKHKFFKLIPYDSVPESHWLPQPELSENSGWPMPKLIYCLFNCPSKSDLKIKTADGVVPAHKMVISNVSDVLHKELYGEKAKDVIEYIHASSKIVLSILSYVYRRELIFGEEILLDLYEISCKVLCADIMTFCLYKMTPKIASQVLSSTPSVDAAFKTQLIERCQKVLVSDLSALHEQGLIKTVPRSVLSTILKSEELSLSEFELYRECDKWAEAECIRSNKQANGENKRAVLGDLRYLIRFPAMSNDELKSACEGDLLTEQEKVQILLSALNGPGSAVSNFNSAKRKLVKK